MPLCASLSVALTCHADPMPATRPLMARRWVTALMALLNVASYVCDGSEAKPCARIIVSSCVGRVSCVTRASVALGATASTRTRAHGPAALTRQFSPLALRLTAPSQSCADSRFVCPRLSPSVPLTFPVTASPRGEPLNAAPKPVVSLEPTTPKLALTAPSIARSPA